MKKYFLAILIVFLAIGISMFIRLYGFDNSYFFGEYSIESENEVEKSNSSKVTSGKNSVKLSVLGEHKTQDDCWVAFDGKVYDITDYLPKHPGTAGRIAPYCGTSEGFENAFTQKHGTSKINALMKFGVLIGDLELVGEIK